MLSPATSNLVLSHSSNNPSHSHSPSAFASPFHLLQAIISFVYTKHPPLQTISPSPLGSLTPVLSDDGLTTLLDDRPSPSSTSLVELSHHSPPRVAIIGAGITGVSSAAHLVASGFDVTLFEKNNCLGGIWSNVNRTSSLQLHSFCYRFHPSVIWSSGTQVEQPEILSQLERIWSDYHLQSKTRFSYIVTHIDRFQSPDGATKYRINDGQDGDFDGLILAIGTCGQPRTVNFKAKSDFKGQWLHSSQLDQIRWNNSLPPPKLVCIGGGASGVEVIETVLDRVDSKPTLITRTDKWFIPRNLFFSSALAWVPAGLQNGLDLVFESLVRKFHYGRDLEFMVPDRTAKPSSSEPTFKLADQPAGIFDQTPIVNDRFLQLVRQRKADYVQAQVVRIHEHAVEIRRNSSRSGKTELISADIIIESTGYERPRLDFESIQKLFSSPNPGQGHDYSPPNLFLGNFAVQDWSCLMLNSAYVHGIGSVGHFHIGILSRMMMMFLADQSTRPNPKHMKKWVDQTVRAKNGPINCFTYFEFLTWLIMFMIFNVNRWRWTIFVLVGLGDIGPIGPAPRRPSVDLR